MVHDEMVSQLLSMLSIVMYMSLPPLIAAVSVGVTVGILQAVTQVQDQSMPLTFKLLTIIAILAVAGPALCLPLMREAEVIFDGFSTMSR
jgi:type III secretion protein S